MKNVLFSVVVVVTCLALLAASHDIAPKPGYDGKGQLIRPADYREWMFLSAGYGMNYSPGPDRHEMFTNAFVQRWAYEEFAKSGKWPEQTMFVIDERDAASRGSINQKGHYQTDLTGLVADVEDSARAIRVIGPTTFSTSKAKPPRPYPRATSAGRAMTLTPPSSTRLCSFIPR